MENDQDPHRHLLFGSIPQGKANRALSIVERWVNGEISAEQADRELQVIGVRLPDEKGGPYGDRIH